MENTIVYKGSFKETRAHQMNGNTGGLCIGREVHSAELTLGFYKRVAFGKGLDMCEEQRPVTK